MVIRFLVFTKLFHRPVSRTCMHHTGQAGGITLHFSEACRFSGAEMFFSAIFHSASGTHAGLTSRYLRTADFRGNIMHSGNLFTS